MTLTERYALELIKRLAQELGLQGPVDSSDGDIYCMLCGADMSYGPASHHANSCLWMAILSNASEQP